MSGARLVQFLVTGAVAVTAAWFIPSAHAKGPTKRKLTLFVSGTGCEHEFEAKPVKLEKAREQAIGWRVRNDCNIQRRVTLCLYDAKGKRVNPFGACTSDPPNISMTAPFTLAASGGLAEIDCAGAQDGAYTAYALVGDLVKSGVCPLSPPKERAVGAGEKTFNHRLAIEIVP